MGLELGLPEKLVEKIPSDGLSGSSDEEKLGFTYAELDNYIRNGTKGENYDKIIQLHNTTAHKRDKIPSLRSDKKNYFENQ